MSIKHLLDKRITKEHIDELKTKFLVAFNTDYNSILGSYQLLSIAIDSAKNNDKYTHVVNRFMRTKIDESVDELDRAVDSLKLHMNKKRLKLSDLCTIHIQITNTYRIMYTIRDYLSDIQELYMIEELKKYR